MLIVLLVITTRNLANRFAKRAKWGNTILQQAHYHLLLVYLVMLAISMLNQDSLLVLHALQALSAQAQVQVAAHLAILANTAHLLDYLFANHVLLEDTIHLLGNQLALIAKLQI